jgi:hypothetical protein
MYKYKWLLHIFLTGIKAWKRKQGIATEWSCTFEGKQLMADILVLLGGCSPSTAFRSPWPLANCPSDRRKAFHFAARRLQMRRPPSPPLAYLTHPVSDFNIDIIHVLQKAFI